MSYKRTNYNYIVFAACWGSHSVLQWHPLEQQMLWNDYSHRQYYIPPPPIHMHTVHTLPPTLLPPHHPLHYHHTTPSTTITPPLHYPHSAMESEKNKGLFLTQVEQFLEGRQGKWTLVWCYPPTTILAVARAKREDEKNEKDRLNAIYLELVEKQRSYYKTVRDFQEVSHEWWCVGGWVLWWCVWWCVGVGVCYDGVWVWVGVMVCGWVLWWCVSTAGVSQEWDIDLQAEGQGSDQLTHWQTD